MGDMEQSLVYVNRYTVQTMATSYPCLVKVTAHLPLQSSGTYTLESFSRCRRLQERILLPQRLDPFLGKWGELGQGWKT